ncbi:protein of unknown function (DUF3328) domain containing protein [Naviculisporaceae sp. PSN 640]
MAQTRSYERLSSTEDSHGESEKTHPKHVIFEGFFSRDTIAVFWRAPILICLFFSAVISTGGLGYVWGVHSSTHIRQFDNLEYGDFSWFPPRDDIRIKYKFEDKFTDSPGNQTSDPWESLITHAMGFIIHPVVAPENRAVSVFHQLHCLNAIRRAYWSAIDGVQYDRNVDTTHVRHCIEYIRHGLMCNADTNLEPIIPEEGGATGFATEHKCRDFPRLRDFVLEWATPPGGKRIEN